MDPFEVRIQFLALLKRLNASQQSIQKVVGFAIKYFPPCGEDLWDCIVEECQKGSINSRINILYFLDSLCETCLLVKSHSNSIGSDSGTKQYVDFVNRDIGKIVECVVPAGREGLPNLTSAKQILESWRSKRVVDPQTVDDVLTALGKRTPPAQSQPSSTAPVEHRKSSHSSLPRTEVFKRIEEDRERHKRLRERRWVQPVMHHAPGQMNLLSFLPLTFEKDDDTVATVDVEFDNDWETTSDWNEDDDEAAADESELCFPAEGEGPMDLD
ncbi:CTD kinase subunit gamma CTK3-domain-containing protein [Roridomyces roridus]|uniref:CTD kinase subunit gamma CTK3-domain-containing protein n=1 Tax=Roridomyces roridus TaxID=1738132 RepID=A0AAD7FUQ1_9AGAR|nr:CTD kinase subunit gamma CTK3-domain-containing protein [Roridomyces roridus]